MTVQNDIEKKLNDALAPSFIEVENESHGHNVAPGSETHFKVVAVSSVFKGLNSVQRHRKIYAALEAELSGGVHALALHTYTPDEWEASGSAPTSPPCLGGSKS